MTEDVVSLLFSSSAPQQKIWRRRHQRKRKETTSEDVVSLHFSNSASQAFVLEARTYKKEEKRQLGETTSEDVVAETRNSKNEEKGRSGT